MHTLVLSLLLSQSAAPDDFGRGLLRRLASTCEPVAESPLTVKVAAWEQRDAGGEVRATAREQHAVSSRGVRDGGRERREGSSLGAGVAVSASGRDVPVGCEDNRWKQGENERACHR